MSRRLDASVDVDAGRQADTRYTLDDLLTLMAVLRDPQYGCPWDSRQDYASLVPHTLEEAYEVADVIERAAADASVLEELPAELGDLLFQGVFYAQIASEQQRFDFHDVIHVLTEKMLHRHPHVFPDGTLASRREGIATHEVDEGSLNAQWESLKQQETADAPASQAAGDSVLDGVPLGLPALTRAAKLSKKAARSGFDWPDTSGVLAKIREELGEVEEALAEGDTAHAREEVGDLMFAVVNLARTLKADPEQMLRATNARFESRFRHVEAAIAGQGRTLDEASLAEMDAHWDEAKRRERAAEQARQGEGATSAARPVTPLVR
ncbi:nucleoside triphosphate pyrophosphohydrolase [Cobetia sp. 1AS1]|uniref:nucleoside triphosphate pyrophosphohydrolase n=1 Tax=Cobetia sp. 1AS1 TaxID=3040016 RepID=UPI00244CDC2B|nr:nucleoside triphosphate pyrophosphohydrolase [Cobetia sp. 1AS1]MDH2293080.1 nucleoside triphosphate pyrophosphohydrolase [Cobetia sp. 1AS1]